MEEYNKLIFAANLNRYIQQKGIKQSDICRLLNVSKSTVSGWCNGQKMPRMDKIEVLANYFCILKSDLIEEKKPPANAGEGTATAPEGYDRLTPANRAIVDRLIADLAKGQSDD